MIKKRYYKLAELAAYDEKYHKYVMEIVFALHSDLWKIEGGQWTPVGYVKAIRKDYLGVPFGVLVGNYDNEFPADGAELEKFCFGDGWQKNSNS